MSLYMKDPQTSAADSPSQNLMTIAQYGQFIAIDSSFNHGT